MARSINSIKSVALAMGLAVFLCMLIERSTTCASVSLLNSGSGDQDFEVDEDGDAIMLDAFDDMFNDIQHIERDRRLALPDLEHSSQGADDSDRSQGADDNDRSQGADDNDKSQGANDNDKSQGADDSDKSQGADDNDESQDANDDSADKNADDDHADEDADGE